MRGRSIDCHRTWFPTIRMGRVIYDTKYKWKRLEKIVSTALYQFGWFIVLFKVATES